MQHPLDPLSSAEIDQARTILTSAGHLGGSVRVTTLAVQEPTKAEVRAFDRSETDRVDRRAFAVCFDLIKKVTYEAVMSLADDTVVSWRARPGVFPSVLAEERDAAQQAVRRDPRFLAALNRRDIRDVDQVVFEGGPNGLFGSPWDAHRRVVRYVPFLRTAPAENYYARPVGNLVAFVDVDTAEVLEVADNGPVPVPAAGGGFSPGDVATTHPELRPLHITQPDGPSFILDGHKLEWGRWQMRIQLHPVEGLVFHRVGYREPVDGRLRSVLYRAGMSEMVVPYGDASTSQYWRNAFDAGEVGMGVSSQSLELGCDCLGEIRYLDVAFADDHSRPYTVRNAVCIHEEDTGIAWKHVGVHVSTSQVRRNRRLVVSHFATIGNYDYGVFWYFYLDGSIEVEVKLTGIVYTGASEDPSPSAGTVIAPGLYAPHHQHVFCFRIDPEVDGADNSVVEVDVVPVPRGLDNPHGNAFATRTTVFDRESQASRLSDPTRARTWKIINEHSRNAQGQPVGYKLIPQYSASLLAAPDSYIAGLAGFATRHLWVTAHHPDEQFAAGRYPVWADRGLPNFVAADRPVRDTDLVVWHTVAATHVVRPEDWPVMPVERVGFALRPAGFFNRNPGLDLPVPDGHCAVNHDSV